MATSKKLHAKHGHVQPLYLWTKTIEKNLEHHIVSPSKDLNQIAILKEESYYNLYVIAFF